MKQKIFLTGGSGYIGSHTLLQLARTDNYELAVFDNFKNGHKKAIQIVSENTGQEIKIFEGDLLNYNNIHSALSDYKPEIIIHFAALIEAGVSMVEPLRFYENNVSGSINLIKAMQENNINKIVFSSTAAVYGTPKSGIANEETPIKYDNYYGETKYFVEQILRSLVNPQANKAKAINSVILRYFNAAGADPDGLIGQDYPKPTHLMTVAIEAAIGLRDKISIFGNDYDTPDGTNIRDYIHVQDLAKAHVKAVDLTNSLNGSEVFCIGTGKGTSNLEVIKALEEIHGNFSWDFAPKRPGDPASYFSDPSKANRVLDWKAEFGFREALLHAYEWKRNNVSGYNA
jgi:UDP-glucose 4-epimerase